MSNPNDPHEPARHARYSRAAHRARSHDEAHGGAEPDPQDTARRPDVPGGEAEAITDDAKLADLIEHLREQRSFAYDSEFIGELTYLPKLCLVQVATTARVALIDPLAGLALRPFWELLADERVEKITHSGQQDVEPVERLIGRPAANVFDTQIAAAFMGMAYPVALNKLVHEIVGVRLGKGLTFTHWDQRPLSAMQLRYAADDVRFLPALRKRMGETLEALGHVVWAREEFAAMCAQRLYHFDPETAYLRVRGANGLGGQALAVLRELTIWRDATARRHDVPPRAFVRDEVLVDLARAHKKDVAKLDRVRGLPRPVEHAHGAEIIAAIQKGLATPPARVPPAHPEPTPTERFRIDALWAAAQCVCIGRRLDPALVTNRQEVGDLYRFLTRGGKEPKIELMSGWRREAVGEPLRRMVQEGTSLTLAWSEGTLSAK